MAERKPKRIYLETWPEWAGREDVVHYEPTGYGVDLPTGATSHIVVYERVPQKRLAEERKAKKNG